MAPAIMYLVENVDDCAYTKREVALTNVEFIIFIFVSSMYSNKTTIIIAY